jgi:hypothetical protein
MVFGRAPTGAKQKMVQPIVGAVSATISTAAIFMAASPETG